VTFILVDKGISGGDVVESGNPAESWTDPEGNVISGQTVNFEAHMVPRARVLMLNKYGQRAWRGFDVFTNAALKLKFDDAVIYGDTQYRVLTDTPWENYGYMQYYIGEDFKFSGPLQAVAQADPSTGDDQEVESGGDVVIM
jgi:hypothetical protein